MLTQAHLDGADLSEANLEGAEGLTQEQIEQASGDAKTRLPERRVQQFASASAGVDHQVLQMAYEAATVARVTAERQLSELEAERSRHGRRGGQLRATLAEAWMRQNGMAMEAMAA